jgi:GrpB-like predicted nucleotidyltransferase (UPF0157 family)
MKSTKYKFVKYDPNYLKLFNKYKSQLIKSLGNDIKIEHVGSSAVPGLGGKGIIDIAIFTPKNKLKTYILGLRELGFKETIDHPADNRRIFMQMVTKEKGKERRVHVHLALTNTFWDSFISFRDYLRKNKKVRDEYARIKKQGAKFAKGDAKKYRKSKEEFIIKSHKKLELR